MNSRAKKITFVAVIGIVAMVVYHDYFADPPGYCGIESRKLSDDELKEIAVKFAFDQGNLKIDGPNPTIKTFISDHPECCRVFHAKKRTIYQKIFVSNYSNMNTDITVKLIYESNRVHPRTKMPLPHRFIEEYVDLDACGTVKGNATIGRRSLEVE